MRHFWQGLAPSIYRTVPGVGIYFGTLSALTNAIGFVVVIVVIATPDC